MNFGNHHRLQVSESPADRAETLEKGRQRAVGHRLQIKARAEGWAFAADPQDVAGFRIDRRLHLVEAPLKIIEDLVGQGVASVRIVQDDGHDRCVELQECLGGHVVDLIERTGRIPKLLGIKFES